MRTFSDDDGQVWQVWKVVPPKEVFVERRRRERRARRLEMSSDRRTGADRRVADNRQGWLCFESASEKRRFYPVPSDWSNWPEPRLAWLCQRAKKPATDR